MTNLWHALVLAIVQGITEFLPVSSSAHLILFPKLFGWPDQGLAFDVAVHIGTLCAVLAYFRHELILMSKDWFAALTGRKMSRNARLAWAIGFGTIPVGIAGLMFNHYIATHMRATLVLACSTLIFGILLGVASLVAKLKRNEYSLTTRDIVLIGCAQALALIPGTSRSGITLTAGLFVGLTRQAAARYSFLLSIPVIILAGGLESYKLIHAAQPVDITAMLFGCVCAAISGYLCIGVFLRLIDRVGIMPFVLYRIILGSTLLML